MTRKNERLDYHYHIKGEISEPWAWIPVFSKEECDKIIEIGNSYCIDVGTVGSENAVDHTIRKGKLSWIPVDGEHLWIHQRCAAAVATMNERYFQYDLDYIESLQFTIYDEEDDFYDKHVDMMYESGATRKLSFSVQLSDPEEYEGGDLEFFIRNTPVYGKRDLGVANFFPSYTLHKVTPITSGKRYSLVGWVTGPKFK